VGPVRIACFSALENEPFEINDLPDLFMGRVQLFTRMSSVGRDKWLVVGWNDQKTGSLKNPDKSSVEPLLQKLFRLVHRLVEKNWGKARRLWMTDICY
jgi:hypothetical protein